MSKISWIERRNNEAQDLTLRRSFLFYVSKSFAYSFVAIGFLLAVGADISSPPTVWLGPIYLFLIAFTAWTISGLLAIALGSLVLAMIWATGGAVVYPYGPASELVNVALRSLSVTMIVGFLVIARKSCEREWDLARTDPLTGALNRQAFFETVEASRYGEQWHAIGYADLDGLKRLNDESGHDAGDKGIKAFTSCVLSVIRKGDVFARIGGDEFVVFMTIRNRDGGISFAERLRQATCSETARIDGALPSSWGILLLPPGPRQIDKELQAADALMYEAKRAGSGIGIGCYHPAENSFDVISVAIGPNEVAGVCTTSRSFA